MKQASQKKSIKIKLLHSKVHIHFSSSSPPPPPPPPLKFSWTCIFGLSQRVFKSNNTSERVKLRANKSKHNMQDFLYQLFSFSSLHFYFIFHSNNLIIISIIIIIIVIRVCFTCHFYTINGEPSIKGY